MIHPVFKSAVILCSSKSNVIHFEWLLRDGLRHEDTPLTVFRWLTFPCLSCDIILSVEKTGLVGSFNGGQALSCSANEIRRRQLRAQAYWTAQVEWSIPLSLGVTQGFRFRAKDSQRLWGSGNLAKIQRPKIKLWTWRSQPRPGSARFSSSAQNWNTSCGFILGKPLSTFKTKGRPFPVSTEKLLIKPLSNTKRVDTIVLREQYCKVAEFFLYRAGELI